MNFTKLIRYIVNPYDSYLKLRYKIQRRWIQVYCKNYNDIFEYEKKNNFAYTKLVAKCRLGVDIDLLNPKTFNEKLIHRRLFSRDPIWPVITDKIAVRDWLEEKGYLDVVKLVPAQVAYTVDELMAITINKPVVVKAAWASGMNLFVNSNKQLQLYKDTLEHWMKSAYAPNRLIWAPEKMKRGFLVEESIADEQGNVPLDYKFFCFNGSAAFMQITFYEGNKQKILCFSRTGEQEKWTYVYPKPSFDFKLEMAKFNKLLSIAEKMAKDFSFIRIDLYFYNGQIYFGELTQTPTSGFGSFTDSNVKYELGSKWNYPNSSKLGDQLI
jgi:hypothetical protein